MKFSQREARRLWKRVAELEKAEQARLRRWATDWPGGTEIARCEFSNSDAAVAIRTARRLKHAVVALADDDDTLRFVALSLPS